MKKGNDPRLPIYFDPNSLQVKFCRHATKNIIPASLHLSIPMIRGYSSREGPPMVQQIQQ